MSVLMRMRTKKCLLDKPQAQKEDSAWPWQVATLLLCQQQRLCRAWCRCVGTRPPRHHRPVGAGPRSLQAAAARTGHCPLVLVTTDNVGRCGDDGDTSELELLDTGSDANMWQTGNMKNLQLLFSVYLLSEVVSMIDKRVINNKNSENNEGINDFMYFLVVSLKTMTTYFPVGIIYRIIKRQ